MSEVQRRELPPGGAFESWPMRDGWRLRVGVWPPARRGTLLFLAGRADFVEKYSEALWWWRQRGWGVVAPDWRGQGGSGRLGRGARGHAADFAPWLDDLAAVVARAATMAAPLVAVGHSMGGHLLLRALVQGETRISRAALTAPMLGIALPRGGWRLAALAARLVTRAGLGHALAPGQGDLAPEREPRRAARLTSCPERGADEAWWFARHPELRLGGVTYGWLAAAARSFSVLQRPGVLEAVTTPVLALLATDETVTDNRAAAHLLARLPHGRHVTVEGRHELLREADGPRRAALARLNHFLEAP